MGAAMEKLLAQGKGYVVKKGAYKGQTRLRESDYLEVCKGNNTAILEGNG